MIESNNLPIEVNANSINVVNGLLFIIGYLSFFDIQKYNYSSYPPNIFPLYLSIIDIFNNYTLLYIGLIIYRLGNVNPSARPSAAAISCCADDVPVSPFSR